MKLSYTIRTLCCALSLFSAALALVPSLAAGEVNDYLREHAYPKPALRSRAAALYDAGNDTLLYSKNGGEVISPASMTKLVTLHLVYRAIEAGEFSRSSEVVVNKAADFHSLPPRSSLMFLEEGQRVTVLELMQGLAVPSGNDAALLLAQQVAGSVEAFVERMNREMRRLGLSETRFADPNGLSEGNRTTAEEFARFCMVYIKAHPRSLEELHERYTFTYPKRQNIPAGESSTYGPITQYNHNKLVWGHPWVDGLKTGYIDESGYNVALTGSNGERRLVAVLLGGPGKNSEEGTLTRAIDGANLLSYGFYSFTRVTPRLKVPETMRVWKGLRRRVALQAASAQPLTIPKEVADDVTVEVELKRPLVAPVHKGEQLGEAVVRVAGKEAARYPLTAAEAVPQGGILRRMWDGVRLEMYIPEQ